MKKALAIALCLILMVALLTGCASQQKMNIVSERIHPSDFPERYKIIGTAIIDIDFEGLTDEKYIEAVLPCKPPNGCFLKNVLIYDGWHAIPARVEWLDDVTIKARFPMGEMEWLDGTKGLTLILVGSKE